MKNPGFAALLLVLTAASCTNRPLTKVEPGTESYIIEEYDQVGFVGVDILVVVDNSLSMKEEQENLAEEFPLLISELLDPPVGEDGKRIHVPVKDLHIGVISTDMGTGGYPTETCDDPVDGDDAVLQHDPNPLIPGCDAAYPTYLSYNSATPDSEAVEKMARDFGCVATLGTDGCGFEQQLKASLKGLTVNVQAGGPNAGFLRPDSLLMILFVTDEEDCSVADDGIFGPDPGLGDINLRCFLHPEMVQPVQQYVDGFRGLRSDPDRLVLGFIVGVPPGSVCEGSGDETGNCLDLDVMQEVIDPDNPRRLRPSCRVDEVGEAYPPRRFVQVAQQLGSSAFLHSICTDDFQPAIEGLTAKLVSAWDKLVPKRELEVEKDPLDQCLCQASCQFIEELPDSRACPTGYSCFEPLGPGTGCEMKVDDSGIEHTLCVIPQAPTMLDDCSLSCTDPSANLSSSDSGWYYLPYGEGDLPQIVFPDAYVPGDGSSLFIQCESMICPDNRQCGPTDFPKAVCCDEDSFCDRDALGGPTCLPRPE